MSRLHAAVIPCLALAACVGDLPSDAAIAAKVDALVQGEIAAQDTGRGPGDAQADASIDAAADAAAADALDAAADATEDAAGLDAFVPECLSNGDCKGRVLGVTSCRVPFCEEGICTLKQLDKGTACTPGVGAATECEVAQCSSSGTCEIEPRPDGEDCGPYKCGKQCKGGKCDPVGPEAYDDGNPCTDDYCKDGNAVVHKKISDLNTPCDDGDPCTKVGFCFEGACNADKIGCDDGNPCTVGLCQSGVGCKFLADDAKCDDGDACTMRKCDPATGCVVSGYADATVTCDDGNTCTEGDHCADKGACTGKAVCACTVAADCKQDNLCLGQMLCKAGVCDVDVALAVTCTDDGTNPCATNTCDPKTGQCEPVDAPDGQECDDGSACTSKSACQAGTCVGDADVQCDDTNSCTDDACDAIAGCTHTPTDAKACDDGHACTSGDVCDKGTCVGTPKDCDDGVSCTIDGCDGGTGACSKQPDKASCDDGNPCTTDTCDPAKGCVHTPDDQAGCDDGNICTKDACQAGTCIGANTCECKADADCDDGNPCTKDRCLSGKCKAEAVADSAKQACDTGDKCQVSGSGVCKAGLCASGHKPKNCSKAEDACNVGVCEPKTGKCAAKPKSEGATCDADGSGCTVGDFCKAGKCEKGAPADCSKSGGPCVQPLCKSTGATSFTCQGKPAAKGTACEDGKWCSASDTCDGAGKCAAGKARACLGASDICNTGLCNESKKACISKPKAETTKCNDGRFCTTKDHCSLGKCVGGPKRACPEGGPCTVGLCNEAGDTCAVGDAKGGTPCDDGNKCTAGDTCDGKGACVGGAALLCGLPNKPCNEQVCNPLTGGCGYLPGAKGGKCDDGEKCTVGDVCDGAGSCVPGKWNSADPACGCDTASDCDDGNACTADSCKAHQCVNTAKKGASCDDGDSCSTASQCNAAGACEAVTKFLCKTANACNAATCDGGGPTPVCGRTPRLKGTSCDDGRFCSAKSACDGVGKCVGTVKTNCNDHSYCTVDACNEKLNKCVHKPKDCSDSNPCTTDKCIAYTGGCYNRLDRNKCDDGNSCTVDACNSADGSCSHGPVANAPRCLGANKCEIFRCQSGLCQDTGVPKCKDNNPCTADKCSVAGACSFPILTGQACDDGNPCTGADQCVWSNGGGRCAGTLEPAICNDHETCTLDSCDPAIGCAHTPTNGGKACHDGDKCTVKDRCKNGTCQGVTRTCDDNTACTEDTCNPATGLCTWVKDRHGCAPPTCPGGDDEKCPKSTDPCLRPKCVAQQFSPSGVTRFICRYKEKCD